MENNTDKRLPQQSAHDLSLETARIMFHGTNQGLTTTQVAFKLLEYFNEAWDALPVVGRPAVDTTAGQ